MDAMIVLLVIVAVVALLGGPLALILSAIALSRLHALERRVQELQRGKAASLAPDEVFKPSPARTVESTPVTAPPVQMEAESPPAKRPAASVLQDVQHVHAEPYENDMLTLEQRIGTRWVLIAGVLALIFAVGFFLKYAYDNRWLTPLTQVAIAAIAGLAALGIGELTRRWGYGFVAKGVTALGFAILYATVFAAHRWHHLIAAPPAYVLAIFVTAAAMAYAVGLNEIAAALLALVGGYLTPVILSTGENLPIPLFTYVLILSGGAMLCAYWRRWTAVNIVAWIGTYLLYTGWFEQFYRPAMSDPAAPEQLGIALLWLTVFFFVFLVLPILHGLRRRVLAPPEDVVLIPINAAVVLYYLWTMLGHYYRTSLALCCLALGVVHLAMAAITAVRCKEDVSLRRVLLAIGLASATLAIPLYWREHAIPAALAIEAVVLVAMGIRYRSLLIQGAAAVVMGIAVAWLMYLWPMHAGPFRVVFNVEFGTWCLVTAAILAGHLLYRFHRRANALLAPGTVLSDVLYAVGLLVLMAAVSAELGLNQDLNRPVIVHHDSFVRQMILVFPAFVLLFVVRPICPRGLLGRVIASALAATGAAYLVVNYSQLHFESFPIFANVNFAVAVVPIAVLFLGGCLIRHFESVEGFRTAIPGAFGLAGVVVLWIILTEEIWLFFRWVPGQASQQWLAQMWISVMWAVYGTALMVVGFWRNIRLLRYIALVLFCLLLGKVFFWDTRTLHATYRIAAFLATGLALVAISYLYQYLKKRGFFDKILSDAGKS